MKDMKKTLIILSLLLLTAGTLPAEEVTTSYFTLAEGDTVRLSPASAGDTISLSVRAHFANRFDRWTLNMSYPEGMEPLSAVAGEDMTVSYLNAQGQEMEYNAVLLGSQDWGVISASTMSVNGYFDMTGTGSYVCYGSVKWEAGDHDDMFTLLLSLGEGFRGGMLTIDGTLSAGSDVREWSNGRSEMFHKSFVLFVPRPLGDMTGDWEVDINDVTAMIGGVLDGSVSSLSGDDLTVSDLNGDGEIDINDITALIDILLNGQ